MSRGTKASDYRCPSCNFWFQLKSQKSPIRSTITDGAYSAMMDVIREDRAPNYFFLHYDLATWTVRNLLLIPHFAVPPSAIIKRPALSQTARRAGWIGCNFALNRIPPDARISIVTTRSAPVSVAAMPLGNRGLQVSKPVVGSKVSAAGDGRTPLTFIATPEEVRAQFRRVKPLEQLSVKTRGWTLDVLNIVRRLGKPEFSNSDVYAFAPELEKLHPDNRHIKEKIRQQLQLLRDTGLLLHAAPNTWHLP